MRYAGKYVVTGTANNYEGWTPSAFAEALAQTIGQLDIFVDLQENQTVGGGLVIFSDPELWPTPNTVPKIHELVKVVATEGVDSERAQEMMEELLEARALLPPLNPPKEMAPSEESEPGTPSEENAIGPEEIVVMAPPQRGRTIDIPTIKGEEALEDAKAQYCALWDATEEDTEGLVTIAEGLLKSAKAVRAATRRRKKQRLAMVDESPFNEEIEVLIALGSGKAKGISREVAELCKAYVLVGDKAVSLREKI